MRRFMTTLCVVGLLGAGAAAALAATPATHTFYSGTGGNFRNHNGSWSRNGTDTFNLTTSGKYYYGVKKFYVEVKAFHGTYNTTCDGTLKIKSSWMKVKPDGSFSFRFASKGAHARVWGTFTARNRAKVNYVVNFAGSNTNPNGLSSSCATWVHGTATS